MNVDHIHIKYQCYNINVQTLVVYATNRHFYTIGKNLPIVR